MNDAAILDLARDAGIAVEWADYAGRSHRVSVEAVRRILAALGLPCDTPDDLAQSRHAFSVHKLPPLVTATAGEAIDLTLTRAGGVPHMRLHYEDGTTAELAGHPSPAGIRLPGIRVPGYHSLEIGEDRITLAVAPEHCYRISDIAPDARLWGLAAQLYGLRSSGDCGIGDMAGVSALAQAAAARGADVLALSPTHALFAAMPERFSPYAPSSRLFYNPLHADARAVFGEERVGNAFHDVDGADLSTELSRQSEIDWRRSARLKMSVFRCLFEDFRATDLAASSMSRLAIDFANFRADGGVLLEDHARFEALQGARQAADAEGGSDWTDWPADWRDPRSAAIRDFAETNSQEVLFHVFLQWIADRSFAAAQAQAKSAGMRVGLLADLAVGMSNGGSHAWTSQNDILGGLEIGAPPDLFNAGGQSWGLTTFSPRALAAGGFAPFIATLRACMRHVGGLRVDHAMGLMRLWVIPHGAPAKDGAYLAYPIDDLLRLTALESHRHRAIVIGEDLGTVPEGFQGCLAATGIYGMRVLWFERGPSGFCPPQAWSVEAAAMTSTHDLPTVAGWWRGRDIEVRAQCHLIKDESAEQADRRVDREALWDAFCASEGEEGAPPVPDEPSRVVDAAVNFIARTPSRLALLPLEDALALEEQPNLPSTIDQHPNWRRRYPGDAGTLLNPSNVTDRLAVLNRRGK